MEYIVICTAAVLVSGLTLFSGFGIGTLLMPVFALFFPVDVAIALTAVVHLLNNMFKFILLGKYADKGVFLRFGLPAIPAAFLGAQSLVWLSRLPVLLEWGRGFQITPVKLLIAILVLVFALLELAPFLRRFSISRRHLPLGGVLSGFFGGVSGFQGAIRSAFLIKSGLTKEAFIATGIMISFVVDLTRLGVYFMGYSRRFADVRLEQNFSLLIAATGAAFLGAFVGSWLIKKVTLKTVRIIVAIMLMGIGVGLGTGII